MSDLYSFVHGQSKEETLRETTESISKLESTVFAEPEDDPRRAEGLCLLGDFWSIRYDVTNETEDISMAIQYTEQALSKIRAEDADLATRLIQLGDMLAKRYEQTKSTSDFQAATTHIERALSFVSTEDSDRVQAFGTLGDLFSTRFKHTGHVADLDAAIEHNQTAFLLTPEDLPHRMDGQGLIGDLLALRYERTGNLDDLNLAISSLEQGVSATSTNNPTLASRLATLGGHFARRYDHLGKAEDFEAATFRIYQAMSMTAEDDTAYATMLDYLGNLSIRRHENTGDMDDLESAMQYSAKVVSATPEDSPSLASRLANFGSRLVRRYNSTRDATDLDSAIENTRKAILKTAGHRDLAARLNNLGTMLLLRYEHAGKLDDLEEAILSSQRAIGLVPEDRPDLPGYLMTLGNALSARYWLTGNTYDLNAAVFHVERAESNITEDHPTYAKVVYSLAHFLSSRYSRTGEITDLDNAISHIHKAIDRTSESDPEHVMYMNGLGSALSSRYKRTGIMNDLEKAISTIQRAMVLVPAGRPRHLECLSHLASMLETRYRSTKNMDDFDKAISAARQVRSAKPKESPEFAECEYRLGRMLSQRLVRVVNKQLVEADLNNPEEEQQCFTILDGLRSALRNPREAIQRSPLAQDLLEALESFRGAIRCSTAIPQTRVRSARAAVATLQFLEEWDGASTIAQDAVKLLPLVCSRHLNRQDQQYAIKETSGIAAIACSLSIKTGHVEQALQQVEFGRGLILGYLIDNKSDISLLKEADSSLSDKFEKLRFIASRAIPDAEPTIRQRAIEQRTKVIQDMDACLERIREIPGHENFQKEPELKELLGGAAEGPVVVVNITDISSDAIIVSESGLRSVALPEMSLEGTSFRNKVFGRHSFMDEDVEDYDRDIQSEAAATTTYTPDFLTQLWKGCVKPILEAIPINSPASEKLPRIWWIGTGAASSLPFHAAGDYSQGDAVENTLSQAIPSYTPTIKALLHARSCMKKPVTNQKPKASLLVVTMPKTPGHTSLQGVTKEFTAIKTAVGDVFTVKLLEQPSVELVLGEVGQSDIVHFACHGSSDRVDPSNSHLLLQEQTPSGAAVGKLTLQQISDSQSAGKARIAYLSACSTAEIKAGSFADEALHLVSAFQVVGFGHVIGTLWSVDDETSVDVARLFYESLRGEIGQATDRAVAEALRKAVMGVRDKLDPREWASYVHFGA